MKAKFQILVLALVLPAVLAPISSAATKTGEVCKKVGQTTVADGMKYKCVKKGSKLVWSTGVVVKAKPAATVPAATVPSASTPVARPSDSASPTSSVTVKPSASATPEAIVAPVGYTMERVKANNSEKSCWSAINGNVYDLTKWIGSHPGGAGAIRALCGSDGSVEFNSQHKGEGKPEARLAGYLLGPLAK